MKCLIKEKLSEHKYRDNNGYLICVDSVLARTGKQRYLRSEIFADAADDDSEIEVDRKPEEVFSEKTLASFENCPLCVEHPDEDVNPDNYKDYAVGFVRDVHKGNVDGQDVILGTLVITDGKTIEEVENGQHTDLSCGYDCDIEDSANPQQRNIRGNHVALCEQGRAGNARIVDTGEKVNNIKDEQVYYKGFVFDYHQGSTPIFYGFTKDKEVQKIQDDYIVYAKNHGHSEVYQYVEGNYEGFTVIIEPGKITMTRLKKFSYLQSDLIKAAKEIENTSNIVFDSINDVEPKQGESKEDFIARFMEETKGEYPDEKQRLAVAYSYWERKNMKDADFSYEDLKRMRIDNYKNVDIYKVNGKYCTNPNVSRERFYTIGEVKEYIDKRFGDSVKDEESLEEKIRKAQEWVDFDIKHHGEVSELTKRDIEKMGLKYNKWNNQVTDYCKDKETTGEEVTKDLEKDFEKFKESRMKDIIPDEVIKRYQDKVDYAIKTFGRIGGGLYDELDEAGLWVDDRNDKYIVKRKVEDSIKDSIYVIKYKDLYHDEKHTEEINANSVQEAIDELKKRVILRGIGTANIYVDRVSCEQTYYPRAYGKLNSLTLDSGKLKDFDGKVISKWIKIVNKIPVVSSIIEHKDGYTFYSGIIKEDKDFQSLENAEEYAKKLGYMKDSCKKDSLINVIKITKTIKKYGK